MFTAALFTIAKTWKQSKCPSTEEWIKKIWYLYIMEYCSCLITTSCLTLRCVSDCSPPGSSVHGTYQARILEWVAIFLLQRIFPALGSNPCLLHWQADSLLLSHQGSPVEYYSAIKKEWHNAFCSNMNGPRDYRTMWRKSDRESQMSDDIAYMGNLERMIQMNLFTKQKQTWKTNLWLTKGREEIN